MAGNVIYDKVKLCFTEVSDFTDFQGIGSDPLYKRYDSVQAVLRTCISEPYLGFLAQPIYNENEDVIEWFVEKWKETPKRLVDLTGEKREKYKRIMEDTVQHYRNAALKLENQEDLTILGGAMKYVSEDMIICYDNKIVMVGWGMRYDTKKHLDLGSLMHGFEIFYQVIFSPGVGGTLEGQSVLNLKAGTEITKDMVPRVKEKQNYTFTAWDSNPVGWEAKGDKVFTALYDKKETPEPVVSPVIPPDPEPFQPEPPAYHNIQFDAGNCGRVEGTSQYSLSEGTIITAAMIPKVTANKGYKFKGWDVNPLNCEVNGEKVFTAQYEKKKNWFAAIWPWLWKLLLALLLILLLILLLRNCEGCSRHHDGEDGTTNPQDSTEWTRIDVPDDEHIIDDDDEWIDKDPNAGGGGIYNPGDPYNPTPTPPEYGDILPPYQGYLPPIGDDDPIRDNPDPGNPVIIENRLNVIMKNTDKSILDLAREFKNRYPGNQYEVVYYDDVVKRMQIKVPSAEREAIKQRLPGEFAPEYDIFVFDESMFESFYIPSDPAMSNNSKAWYLSAINAFDAWDITMGSEDIVVAVVDNGFSLNHKEIKDKVVMQYNVWEHNRNIYAQREDHGTHVAGTAVANSDNGEGLCGIAPKCRLMPIQVADRLGRITITSMLDGILYALYQGADVVNVSLGMSFMGLDQYPEDMQQELIDRRFKEEQRMWEEVSRIAEMHKAAIVVAAGNDKVLAGIDALHRPSNIIVVAALNKSGQRYNKARFSNYGEYSTISAPGVDIYSCSHDGYEVMEGTSMASPVVAGAVALMKSLNKNLTTQQIICVLKSTGSMVDSKVGPMLQLDKALQKVKNNEIYDCIGDDVEPPVLPKGDVEITLRWNDRNDVDLHCIDPNGEELYYSHKRSRSGGIFEVDMNAGDRNSSNPVEYIYWPHGGAPFGSYTVKVIFFSRKDENAASSPYTLVVKHGNVEETYTGTVSKQNKEEIIRFNLRAD